MLWFKKRPDAPAATERDLIIPGQLPVAFDEDLFAQHLSRLQHGAERDGGLESYLDSLGVKHRLFVAALSPDRIDALGLDETEVLLDTVFTARRRLFPLLQAMGAAAVRQAVAELAYGDGTIAVRLQRFVAALPIPAGGDREGVKAAAKARRAGFDFGAELLHFFDPVRYPLMARWVWDQGTVSGALREFIRGNDQMAEIPLGASPEMFEGARQWLGQRIADQGVFRDLHFWIDLVLAQAYVTYFRSMAEGGLGGDFGRGARPEDQLKKLLGIDAGRKNGRTRVKKQMEPS